MRIVTHNVNSLRARQERVLEWIDTVEPDVLCLQETKLGDDAVDVEAFSELGYAVAHYGQGQWNGVAIMSRVGLENVTRNFADGIDPDPDARIISADCGGVRVVCCYVPNGRALDDEHYRYKLSWLDRLHAHLDAEADPDRELVVLGDFNVAPEDRDVYDPAVFTGSTHVSDDERDRLAALVDWGLTDLFRQHHPSADKVYSWWDYRNGDFHKGNGLRIDLVYGTRSISERLEWAVIDRNARKGKSPSDHAPVIVDLRE